MTHFEVERDNEDAIKIDEAMRPKIKKRPHDFSAGGFDSIARRYGSSSNEVAGFRQVYEERRQTLFAWTDDMARQESPELDALLDPRVDEAEEDDEFDRNMKLIDSGRENAEAKGKKRKAKEEPAVVAAE